MNRIILFILVLVITIHAQEFSVEEYNNFLQQNQNMTATELLSQHDAGIFRGTYSLNYDDVLFYDSIAIKYNLTEAEKELISQNGFVVTQRLAQQTFGQQLVDIYHKDLPVFVTTDAILHAFHMSYDKILMEVELGMLIPDIEDILFDMRASLPALINNYAGAPGMATPLTDIDVYLGVALNLIGNPTQPVYSNSGTTISQLLSLIDDENVASYPLFGEFLRTIDFSQFKPRGHYEDEQFPELAQYFRTMIWLGRTEFYLTAPTGAMPLPQFSDIQRQVIASALISELVELSGVTEKIQKIENTLKFFVGEQDNVTLTNLNEVMAAISVSSPQQFLDSTTVIIFQDTLLTNEFATQKILSQILMNNPLEPGEIKPASAFMLLGQRFVVDSYVTGSVVFDRIKFNGEEIKRMLPSTLDILFALGNDAAAQLLVPELEEYKYSTNLASLRYLIDSYDDTHWKSSIYYMWLNGIRKLNPPASRETLPVFMQSAAWWQQKMNTQLSSWTELRHDNLLYAKQSYTGGTVCSYPYSYVEPYPEFYEWMKVLSEETYTGFSDLEFSDPYAKEAILNYFDKFRMVCDTLGGIATKELSAIALSDEETMFLHRMLYDQVEGYNTPPYDGWYPQLYYDAFGNGLNELLKQDYIVADYHTAPTDAGGSMVGWVKHAGTGPVDMGIVVADHPSGQKIAFIGPVTSYHEYTSTNFYRVSDSEWNEQYLALSARPDWVNIYLADGDGGKLAAGAQLVTSVRHVNDGIIPESEILVSNYPNPFNPSTYISFSIPSTLMNKKVTLKVYDIQGQLISTILNEVLPSGTYVAKWDGKSNTGKSVSSGIYIYEVTAGDKIKAGKMNLIK